MKGLPLKPQKKLKGKGNCEVIVIIRPSLRLRFVRTIVTTLFLSLFATFPVSLPLQSASAAPATITKTVTIKGSNNAAYNGAQVALVY